MKQLTSWQVVFDQVEENFLVTAGADDGDGAVLRVVVAAVRVRRMRHDGPTLLR